MLTLGSSHPTITNLIVHISIRFLSLRRRDVVLASKTLRDQLPTRRRYANEYSQSLLEIRHVTATNGRVRGW